MSRYDSKFCTKLDGGYQIYFMLLDIAVLAEEIEENDILHEKMIQKCNEFGMNSVDFVEEFTGAIGGQNAK